MAKLALTIAISFVIAVCIDVSSSQCCYRDEDGLCEDDTQATPCCAYRRCNIFCCNCSDGGCRRPRYGKRDVSGKTGGADGFHKIDKDGNGLVDRTEAHNHLLSGACGNYTELIGDFHDHFNKFDKDGDGKLSYEEINTAG